MRKLQKKFHHAFFSYNYKQPFFKIERSILTRFLNHLNTMQQSNLCFKYYIQSTKLKFYKNYMTETKVQDPEIFYISLQIKKYLVGYSKCHILGIYNQLMYHL